MSQANPWGRATPRWSVAGQSGPPASWAGPPGTSAWVRVGPPLFASEPRTGSVFDRYDGKGFTVKPDPVAFDWSPTVDACLRNEVSVKEAIRLLRDGGR